MNDLISRQWLMECVNEGWIKFDTEKDENKFIHLVRDIAPSAQPYTEAEIQKMQELEQAELDKAYECGRASAQPEIIRCKMSLKDAIEYYDHLADECRRLADECRRNASIERNDYMDLRDMSAEYRQLAIWLNELLMFRLWWGENG